MIVKYLKCIPSHLKSLTMLFNNSLSRRSSHIRIRDGLISGKTWNQKSVRLLTKSRVSPSNQSSHVSSTRKGLIYWVFMVTKQNIWWLKFHTITCLNLTIAYFIHLAHCLHIKKKCILGLVKESLIMMNTWISINGSLCNARLFLRMMIISSSLVHS